MKRNFLLIALVGAFGMALLGSASRALATCPAGTNAGGLAQSTGSPAGTGNYAIKIGGAVTETSASDSGDGSAVPLPESGLGVIQVDGACDVVKGELIFSIDKTVTAPTSFNIAGAPFVPGFSGTMTSAGSGVHGSYAFNSNNQGTMTLIDGPSGQTLSFGINSALAGAEFRGARINPGDPLVIVGERQTLNEPLGGPFTSINPTTFNAVAELAFDAGGGGSAGSLLGVGFDAVGVQVAEHFDPETNSSVVGGGTIVFNIDNGYDSTILNGSQFLPPGGGPLIAGFHTSTVFEQSFTDGTQVTTATLTSDFGFPLGGANFQTAAVAWGSSNSNLWVATVGDSGNASPGIAQGTAGRMVAVGTDHETGGVVTVHSTGVPAVITLTNDSVEPLDFTGLTLSPALSPYVTTEQTADCTGANAPYPCCTGSGTGTCGTCTNGGDVAADQVLFGPGVCTVFLANNGTPCSLATGANNIKGSATFPTPGPNWQCTGAGTPFTCCTGAGTGSGTGQCQGAGAMSISGNDHAIIGCTQNTGGCNNSVSCTH